MLSRHYRTQFQDLTIIPTEIFQIEIGEGIVGLPKSEFCGQIHHIPKPRHPWPPWCNHDDSAPVGGYLLNYLMNERHWTKHIAVQTLQRDVQCICFPSLTVRERRHIHWKLVIQLCCTLIYHWLMPAMANLIEHLMIQCPFSLNHLVFS